MAPETPPKILSVSCTDTRWTGTPDEPSSAGDPSTTRGNGPSEQRKDCLRRLPLSRSEVESV